MSDGAESLNWAFQERQVSLILCDNMKSTTEIERLTRPHYNVEMLAFARSLLIQAEEYSVQIDLFEHPILLQFQFSVPNFQAPDVTDPRLLVCGLAIQCRKYQSVAVLQASGNG